MSKIKIVKRKYESPYKDIIKEIHKKEIVEKDYFKNRRVCVLGAKKPIQNYSAGNIPDEDLIGWNIRRDDFLSLSVIARSGSGKTRLLKPTLNQYYKQGFKVLVFSPKQDEWSSARKKGNATRLHQFQKNESMPVVCYAPSFVRNYLEKNNDLNPSYKYYSHSIKNFIQPEIWTALGFTPTASSHCVGLINQGVNKLKVLQNKIKFANNLHPISRNSAVDKIESLMNAKFFNDRLNGLDLEKEWDINNNVIAINYHAQRGSMLSFDVWMLIDYVRKYCQKKQNQGLYQPVLILFDDANYYASSDSHNHFSKKAILDCQSNLRSYGVNPIISYQLPEMVDEEIRKSSEKYILASLYDVSTLKGAIPEDVRYMLSAKMEDNGLYVDKFTYTREWVYIEDREGYRFFPFDCNIGH